MRAVELGYLSIEDVWYKKSPFCEVGLQYDSSGSDWLSDGED